MQSAGYVVATGMLHENIFKLLAGQRVELILQCEIVVISLHWGW